MPKLEGLDEPAKPESAPLSYRIALGCTACEQPAFVLHSRSYGIFLLSERQDELPGFFQFYVHSIFEREANLVGLARDMLRAPSGTPPGSATDIVQIHVALATARHRALLDESARLTRRLNDHVHSLQLQQSKRQALELKEDIEERRALDDIEARQRVEVNALAVEYQRALNAHQQQVHLLELHQKSLAIELAQLQLERARLCAGAPSDRTHAPSELCTSVSSELCRDLA